MNSFYRRRRFCLWAFLAIMLMAGAFAVPASAAGPPGAFAAPGLRVTPPIINFGSVARGDTRDRTVSITNTGSEPADFSRMGPALPFPLFSWNIGTFLDNCPLQGPAVPEFLMPGDTCTLTLIAQPGSNVAPGRYNGTFVIGVYQGPDLVVVPLSVLVR